jgi:hypothetical protein
MSLIIFKQHTSHFQFVLDLENYFTGKATKAQRSEVVCLKSHSELVAELGLHSFLLGCFVD